MARALLVDRTRTEGLVFQRQDWSGCKARLDRHLGAAITEAWVHHDIRRSVATGMAEMDVAPHVIESVLNHASGHRAGVSGVYNKARLEPQKRNALERWGDRLEATLTGKSAETSVVPFAARGA